MRYDGLLDGHPPRWSRDDLMEHKLGLRAYYQDPVPPPPDPPPPDPPPPDPPDPELLDLPDDESKAKLKEILADRRRKNHKLIEETAKREAAEAKIAKLLEEKEAEKRAKMDAAELAKVERDEALAKLAASTEALARTERLRVIAQAGVDPQYEGYIESQLSSALGGDENLDVAKWLAEQKEKRPLFFGDAPALSTSGGPQRTATNAADVIREELKKLATSPLLTQEDGIRKMQLTQQLARITGGQKDK